MKNENLLFEIFLKSILLLYFPIIVFAQNQPLGISDYELHLHEDKCGYNSVLAKQALKILGDKWGYSYDSLLNDLDKWEQSPYVQIDSIGSSVQQRILWQLTITDPDSGQQPKRTVFVHARTHPNEVQSFWVTDEMINLLLSNDPVARLLRRNCVFYVIPMYNPDGVELEYGRENASGIDIESNWFAEQVEPEVAALKARFSDLMNSDAPIEVALNMHSAFSCKRYFVYHHENGTSVPFTVLEKQFIGDIKSYYPEGIEPWNYYVSWTNGTPERYPESWFWLNFQEAVMALTYEDMNCESAGNFQKTASAVLNGIADYLGLEQTAITDQNYGIVKIYTLLTNFPNPFNPSTKIQFTVPEKGNVRLDIFNIRGELIDVLVDKYYLPGMYEVDFHAAGLASGTYYLYLQSNTFSDFLKITLLK